MSVGSRAVRVSQTGLSVTASQQGKGKIMSKVQKKLEDRNQHWLFSHLSAPLPYKIFGKCFLSSLLLSPLFSFALGITTVWFSASPQPLATLVKVISGFHVAQPNRPSQFSSLQHFPQMFILSSQHCFYLCSRMPYSSGEFLTSPPAPSHSVRVF